jgi:hypothetical protein
MDYRFAPASGGRLPLGVDPNGHGHEADGTPLWVARSPGRSDPAFIGSIQLGKVRPGLGAALIPFGGREVAVADYEVLMQPGVWVAASAGERAIPDGAIVCGREANGDPLFVARARLNGSVHPGKVRFELGAALISFGGREIAVQDYEVLVSQDGLR